MAQQPCSLCRGTSVGSHRMWRGGANNGFVNTGAFGGISNSISGIVSKGPVNGAQVCAYSINAGAVVAQIGNCATTSPSGNYTVNLGTYVGPVLLQATHGTYTDEATGQPVSLMPPRPMLACAARLPIRPGSPMSPSRP